jgi:hypothetical protein
MSTPCRPFDFSTSDIHVVDLAKLGRDLGSGEVFQKSGRIALPWPGKRA